MRTSIRQIFQRISDQVSNHPAPLLSYIFLFFAILAVRLTLEFFSSHRLFSFPDVIHIGLWFMFIVLAFMVQLHLFSRVSMEKVIRLCVVGFSIALSAPVIDLIVTGGQGAKMNYLSLNTWEDIVLAYITAGGPSLTRGATLGIRIEIGLLVIGCLAYIFLHTQNLARAFAGSICIYTVLFLSGSVPRILMEINALFHLTFAHDDDSTSLFLLLMDILLLLVVLQRLNMLKPLLISSPKNVLVLVLGILIFAAGARLAMNGYPQNWSLNTTTLFWFPLLFLLTYLFSVWFNQGYQPVSARLLLIPVLVCAAMLSLKGLFICAGLWGILFLRDAEPLRLRQSRIIKVLLDSMFCTGVVLAGFVFWGAPMVGFPAYLIWAVMAGSFGCGLAQLAGNTQDEDQVKSQNQWLNYMLRFGSIALLTLSSWLLYAPSGDLLLLLSGILPILPTFFGLRKSAWYILAFYPVIACFLYRIS